MTRIRHWLLALDLELIICIMLEKTRKPRVSPVSLPVEWNELNLLCRPHQVTQNHIKPCLQKQLVKCKELYTYKLSLLLNQLGENCFDLLFHNYHFRKFQGPWAHTAKCFHYIFFFNGKVGDDFFKKRKEKQLSGIYSTKQLSEIVLGHRSVSSKFHSPCFYNYGWNSVNFVFPQTIPRQQENFEMFSVCVLNSLKEIDLKIKIIL